MEESDETKYGVLVVVCGSGESEYENSDGETATDTSEADLRRFEAAIKCGVSAWF